jgi:hypothetical protein
MARARELLLMLHAQWALLRARRRLRHEPHGQMVGAAGPDTEAAEAASRASDRSSQDAARALERAVARASRYGMIRPLCLERALALHAMLEARGLTGSRVRVGVRLSGESFAAHAWVEFRGIVLGDTPAHVSGYVPLSGAEFRPLS